ncbi:hypothetical protein ACSNOI_39255 [Actinomadura kijaniata]|uniref:hypothetical protein n=1 Tax=Actinomadura kijaniata TaxID=46161 RepID=UPI003F1E3AFF
MSLSSTLAAMPDMLDQLHPLAVPNPGQGEEPPGAAGVKRLLAWVAWCVSGACVFGIMMVAGKMAISHRRGEGGEHAAGLAWVLGACILLASASALVGAMLGGDGGGSNRQ